MAEVTKIKDTITPDLQRKLKAMQDRTPYLKAMGTAVVSLAQRAFTDEGLRPSTWEKRKVEPKDGHAPLIESGALRKSIRISSVTNKEVTISSDRPYAAAHQFGYPEHNLPARPFLPFDQSGHLTAKGAEQVEMALRAALKARAGLV